MPTGLIVAVGAGRRLCRHHCRFPVVRRLISAARSAATRGPHSNVRHSSPGHSFARTRGCGLSALAARRTTGWFDSRIRLACSHASSFPANLEIARCRSAAAVGGCGCGGSGVRRGLAGLVFPCGGRRFRGDLGGEDRGGRRRSRHRGVGSRAGGGGGHGGGPGCRKRARAGRSRDRPRNQSCGRGGGAGGRPESEHRGSTGRTPGGDRSRRKRAQYPGRSDRGCPRPAP